MKTFLKIALLIVLVIGCEKNTELPLPTNPLESFALPESEFFFTVTPNPMPRTETTQTWSIIVENDIDLDVTGINYRVYDPDSNYVRGYTFTEGQIKALFEYVYIPPETTITGTRSNDFTDPSGYRVVITLTGIDENQNEVSDTDTVIIE